MAENDIKKVHIDTEPDIYHAFNAEYSTTANYAECASAVNTNKSITIADNFNIWNTVYLGSLTKQHKITYKVNSPIRKSWGNIQISDIGDNMFGFSNKSTWTDTKLPFGDNDVIYGFTTYIGENVLTTSAGDKDQEYGTAKYIQVDFGTYLVRTITITKKDDDRISYRFTYKCEDESKADDLYWIANIGSISPRPEQTTELSKDMTDYTCLDSKMFTYQWLFVPPREIEGVSYGGVTNMAVFLSDNMVLGYKNDTEIPYNMVYYRSKNTRGYNSAEVFVEPDFDVGCAPIKFSCDPIFVNVFHIDGKYRWLVDKMSLDIGKSYKIVLPIQVKLLFKYK